MKLVVFIVNKFHLMGDSIQVFFFFILSKIYIYIYCGLGISWILVNFLFSNQLNTNLRQKKMNLLRSIGCFFGKIDEIVFNPINRLLYFLIIYDGKNLKSPVVFCFLKKWVNDISSLKEFKERLSPHA